MNLSVDLLLEYIELNIVPLDVDVGVSEKSADLLDVYWSYPVIAMSSSHCLRESDERFKLSDSDFVGSLILGLLFLSDRFVLLFKNHG